MSVEKLTNEQIVYDLLQGLAAARDSDAFLYFAYLTTHTTLREEIGGAACNKLLKVMTEGIPPESLRRVRQKIQERGEFHGTSLRRCRSVERRVRKLIASGKLTEGE